MASKKKFKKYSEINFEAPKRKDIVSLLHLFFEREIEIDEFERLFMVYFDREGIDPDFFNHDERRAIDEISEVVSWYSPYDSDHQLYDGFTNKEDVERVVEKNARILSIM